MTLIPMYYRFSTDCFQKDDFKQMNDISRDFCIDMKNQQ